MKKIPSLDLGRQINPIRRELDNEISKVIDKADFIFGNVIKDFEGAVSRYLKVRYALGVSNGTDAIRLSLLALGVKHGDKVICPAFTYFATAGAIASIGAIPVFTDIDKDTYSISADCVEKALKSSRRGSIKAIIPVHLYGQCVDMDAIRMISKKYNLKVVEDAAQAFGARYKGRSAGSMGDCGAISFFPSKNLGAFGDAGMVLTNNKSVYEKITILRNQGNKEKYHHTMLGFNNRMDTIQAAVLKVKLKYLGAWNKKRRGVAKYFNRKLAGVNVKTPVIAKFNTHIYHQYVLQLNSDSKGLMRHLKNRGISCRVYYPIPLHLQRCFRYLGYKRGDFPVSEKASKNTLALPIFPELTREEMDYIINSIKEFYK